MAQRTAALERCYRRVQHERMGGLGLLNPALSVQALGFEPAAQNPALAEGVLLTPWFMSLLRLPLRAQAPAGGRIGQRSSHAFGNECFDFLGAFDAEIGYYESCALFSPMHGFDSQPLALQTAQEVLRQLRQTPAALADAAADPGAERSSAEARALASRRAFFRYPLGGTGAA